MAVVYDQSQSRNWRHQRYAAQADVEARQQADAHARARRRALHNQLHDFFTQAQVDDADRYDGPLTTREGAGSFVEQYETVPALGNKLHPKFVEYMGGHKLPDPIEQKRRRQLAVVLDRLACERADFFQIVEVHSRTHEPLIHLSARWHVGSKTVTEGYAEGLDLMLEWLGDADA